MSHTRNTDRYALANDQVPAGQLVDGNQNAARASQMDESAAVAALGGNAELLKELGAMFCEDAPLVLSELKEAVSQGDAPAARRAAHSIKGLAGTFFARNTCEIALRLENDAAEGNLAALQAGGIDRLSKSIRELSDELGRRGLTT